MRHGAMVKLCSKVRCTNVAKKGGVCMRHGAKHKQCDSDGCTNKSVNGGVCIVMEQRRSANYAAAKSAKKCYQRRVRVCKCKAWDEDKIPI